LTGQTFDSIPRFKNQYFVAFKYSPLAGPEIGIDPKDLIGITHRVKTIDAPRMDIETETLNQYNKPRILPTKLNYNPITITFWDDRSNEVTNFWKQIYEFYFHNGRRSGEASYGVRDSNTITDLTLGNSAPPAAYNNYGYYVGNKANTFNLFQHMSLYLVANKACHRIDLINPYLQSMQHDQFSQEMSGELAQNTVTWGYENVVYYGRQAIENEPGLMAVIEGDRIFHWDDPTYTSTATGESTTPSGKNPGNIIYPGERRADLPEIDIKGIGKHPISGPSSATKAPTGNDIDFYPKYGSGLGGYRPVSGINANISEKYRALAAKETSYTRPDDYPDIDTYMDRKIREEKAKAAAAMEFDFGSGDFQAEEGNESAGSKLDKIKEKSDASGPMVGTNNRPTVNKPFIGPNGTPNVAFKSQQLGAPQSNVSSGHQDDPTGAR
jgi:hypothetical protein